MIGGGFGAGHVQSKTLYRAVWERGQVVRQVGFFEWFEVKLSAPAIYICQQPSGLPRKCRDNNLDLAFTGTRFERRDAHRFCAGHLSPTLGHGPVHLKTVVGVGAWFRRCGTDAGRVFGGLISADRVFVTSTESKKERCAQREPSAPVNCYRSCFMQWAATISLSKEKIIVDCLGHIGKRYLILRWMSLVGCFRHAESRPILA